MFDHQYEKIDRTFFIGCCSNNLIRKGIFFSRKEKNCQVYECSKCKKAYLINNNLINPIDNSPVNNLIDIMQEEDIERLFRNKNCKFDCVNIKEIVSSQVDPGLVCGEGEYTALTKCIDCGRIYFHTVFCEIDKKLDVLYAEQYSGSLNEKKLKKVVSKMKGNISPSKIEFFERF